MSDGWAHLAAVIDGHDRETVGYEFARRGRPNRRSRRPAWRASARCARQGVTPVIRFDNRLVYQSRRFRAAGHASRLRPEVIMPYTPEQKGIIERFFRSLKEECVWQHLFPSSRRRAGSSPRGSAGTTRGARIRPWAVRAHSNIGRNNVDGWLDFTPAARRKLLDGEPLSADSPAHRAARVAPDVIESPTRERRR
jgi:transposase InsO family protein